MVGWPGPAGTVSGAYWSITGDLVRGPGPKRKWKSSVWNLAQGFHHRGVCRGGNWGKRKSLYCAGRHTRTPLFSTPDPAHRLHKERIEKEAQRGSDEKEKEKGLALYPRTEMLSKVRSMHAPEALNDGQSSCDTHRLSEKWLKGGGFWNIVRQSCPQG